MQMIVPKIVKKQPGGKTKGKNGCCTKTTGCCWATRSGCAGANGEAPFAQSRSPKASKVQPGTGDWVCAGVNGLTVWKQVTTPVNGFCTQVTPVCACAVPLLNASTTKTATSRLEASSAVRNRVFPMAIPSPHHIPKARSQRPYGVYAPPPAAAEHIRAFVSRLQATERTAGRRTACKKTKGWIRMNPQRSIVMPTPALGDG